MFTVKTYISHHFCPWKPQNGIFPKFIQGNAILGLLYVEMVRNICFGKKYSLSDLCSTLRGVLTTFMYGDVRAIFLGLKSSL